MDFIGPNQVLNGLWPTATRWDTGSPASTQAVNMGKYEHATFVLYEAAGGAGTGTITMEACATAAGGTPTAIGFRYRLCSTQDVWADAVTVASTGYLMIAGANKMVAVEVDAEELTADKPFLRMKVTVGVATAVVGGVMIILTGARNPQNVPVTAIT